MNLINCFVKVKGKKKKKSSLCSFNLVSALKLLLLLQSGDKVGNKISDD